MFDKRTSDDSNVCSMKYNGRGNVREFYKYLYRNAHIYLERKKAIFDRIVMRKEYSVKEYTMTRNGKRFKVKAHRKRFPAT